MPTLEDYASLAPFTLDELVDAANSILRQSADLQIQGRTIRYYISNGLLPPPQGSPKYARYGYEHLLRLVAIRTWLSQGVSLEQAAERIRNGEHGGETDTVTRRKKTMDFDAMAFSKKLSRVPTPEKTVRRFPLTSHAVLEIDTEADLGREARQALVALERLVAHLKDTT